MVRIIAGYWKGRRIKTTEGKGYRPAMSRVREALFSMLTSRGVQWDTSRILDVFAGSGSLGWEALSRGAREVCFLENDPKALRLLREQAVSFFRPGQDIRILAGDALRVLSRPPERAAGRRGETADTRPDNPQEEIRDGHAGFDVLFFDPPYGRDLLARSLSLARENGWIAPEALICAEVEADWPFQELELPGHQLETQRLYGQTRILVWKKKLSAKNGSLSIPEPSTP